MEFLAFLIFALLLFSAAKSWYEKTPSNRSSEIFLGIIEKIFKGIVKGVTVLIVGYQRQEDIYGSARFSSKRELRKVLKAYPQHEGIVIDGKKNRRLSLSNSTEHVFVCGRSGSGKTKRYLEEQLLRESNCSVVVFDPGKSLLNRCSGYMREQGYQIDVLDLQDRSMTQSKTINFLDYATGSNIRMITYTLIRSAMEAGQRWSHWERSTHDMLSKLIFIMNELPEFNGKRDMGNLVHLLNSMGNQGERIAPLISNCSPTAQTYWNSLIEQTPEAYENTLSTAKATMALFNADSHLVNLVRSTPHAINFSDLRRRKTALFVACSESEVQFNAPFLNVFWTLLFQFLLKKRIGDEPYRQTNIYIDEFASAFIPDFETVAATIRQRMVSISILVQNIEQLSLRYGHNGGATILSNLNTHIYLGRGITSSTAQKLEHMLGRQTIKGENGLMGRALMTAQELEQMDYPYALFMQGGKPPAKIKMEYSFKDPVLQRRSQIPKPTFHYDNTAPMQFVDFGNTGGIPLTHQVGLD